MPSAGGSAHPVRKQTTQLADGLAEQPAKRGEPPPRHMHTCAYMLRIHRMTNDQVVFGAGLAETPLRQPG